MPEVAPGHEVAQVAEEGPRLEEGEDAGAGHVLGGLDRLEADEGDLHGAEQADDEEGVVGHVDAVAVTAHQQ